MEEEYTIGDHEILREGFRTGGVHRREKHSVLGHSDEVRRHRRGMQL